jgi:hypothetical protein
MEKWQAVPGYPSYEASNLGHIRSIDRVVLTKAGKSVRHWGKVLKSAPGGTSPYLLVNLPSPHGGEKFTHQLVHSLICATFNGPKPSHRHEVAHNDGNPLNNCASNLRWATRAENRADQIGHGTRLSGSKNHKAIFSERDIVAIRALHDTGRLTHQAIADLFNMSRPNVSLIVNGINWRHLP